MQLTIGRLPGNDAWLDQFNALFIMEWEVIWTCECNAVQPLPHGTNINRIGIESLGIQPEGIPDSVQQAIARKLIPEELGDYTCVTCGHVRTRTETYRIDGAPDILRLKLNIVELREVKKGGFEFVRKNNYIKLNPVLDLQRYQAVQADPAPLRYRLKSVLCHDGDFDHGHWAATVTDKTGVSHIDDDEVYEEEPAFLHTNPHHDMQAAVLTYTRIETRGM